MATWGIAIIPAIEQDDFPAFSGWAKTVAGKHTCLLPTRALERFIEEIQEKPLALDFVRIVLSAVLHAVVVIIPNPDDTALFAERFVLGIIFFSLVATRQI